MIHYTRSSTEDFLLPPSFLKCCWMWREKKNPPINLTQINKHFPSSSVGGYLIALAVSVWVGCCNLTGPPELPEHGHSDFREVFSSFSSFRPAGTRRDFNTTMGAPLQSPRYLGCWNAERSFIIITSTIYKYSQEKEEEEEEEDDDDDDDAAASSAHSFHLVLNALLIGRGPKMKTKETRLLGVYIAYLK